MSDALDIDAGDPDLLAAEYVVGVLDEAERVAARARINADAGFRHSVDVWERRLTPLSALADDVAPPADLWGRVVLSTSSGTATPIGGNVVAFPPKAPRAGLWKTGTAVGFAIAAGLAAFILVRSPAPQEVAVLTPTTAGPVLVAFAGGSTGGLTVRPAAALSAIPSDRDLELWALPEGAKAPLPLGVLPLTGRHLATVPKPGTKILVSLEPKGGSPTGLPTGPVVYAGQLETL